MSAVYFVLEIVGENGSVFNMSRPANTKRNEDLVRKRITDPKYWSFEKLGRLFNINKKTAHELFEYHILLHATKLEILNYRRMFGYPKVKVRP